MKNKKYMLFNSSSTMLAIPVHGPGYVYLAPSETKEVSKATMDHLQGAPFITAYTLIE